MTDFLFELIPIHAAFGHAAIVPQHLSLDRCITLLEDWLHECKTRHEYCLAALPKLPKRLLYVAEETPRLVEIDGLAYSRYTTLSHCWGKERDMIKTTGANLRLRTIGIESGELPQIFKDAISVTKLIGCQWIWIDSLCIVQDDKADWEEESTKMADVYSNSFLNIATTFSDSSLRSCFSNRKIIGFDSNDPADRRELEWPVKSIGIAGDPGLFVRASHLTAHQHIADSSEGLRSTAAPLLERAWIFQERLLAPRTLHFDSTELIWECNTTLACECNMIAETCLTENRQKHKFAAVCQDRISNDQEILDLWLATVRIYSSLGLTKLSDRPYALAGIASRISDKLHSSYLAGIWAGDLPRALLWNIFVPKEDKPRPSSLSLGYPTWSWMSQYDPDHSNGSGVYYDSDIKVFVQDPRLEIHHSNTFCTYPNNNNDPFGAVLSGHLDITSATVQGKVIIADKSWYLFKAQTGWRGGSLVLDCPKVDGVENGAEVLCLLIGKMTQVIQALLLKLLHGSTNYIRVGYIQFHESKVDEVEVMRVQIV